MSYPLPTNEFSRKKRERCIIITSVLLVSLFTFIGYYLVAGPGEISPFANILIFAILDLNIILILLVFFLIIRQVVKFFLEERPGLLGAKLRTKLVIAFVSLSLIPTILLFWVSFQFLKTSVGYWFNIKIERALDDALKLGQNYYQAKMSQVVLQGKDIHTGLLQKCPMENAVMDRECMEGFARSLMEGDALDVPIQFFSVMSAKGEISFSMSKPPMDIGSLPDVPMELLKKAVETKEVISQGITLDKGFFIMAVFPVKDTLENTTGILSVGSLIPGDISKTLDEIRQGYEDYRQLLLYQTPLKGALLATLFLITLLIIFVAIWFAFRIARAMTEPIQKLAEATQRVAQGDLDFTLEARGRDELGSLLNAFNTMTIDLKEARRRVDEASKKLNKSYKELEQRGKYIEIILQNVAAGVISIDRKGIVTTMNRSAEEILSISSRDLIGRSYKDILNKDHREEFEKIRMELEGSSKKTMHRPIRIVSGEKFLYLLTNFTVLRDQENNPQGVVVVFEDLTELEKIQRLAAWREVARRVAHEVKNPLTPIQLSAQRLRKKCMNSLDGDVKKVLDACTNTIIQQVDELKHLVNEFSSFARMPASRFAPVRLKSLIEQLLTIYREGHPNVKFSLTCEGDMPEIMLDEDQIKRVLINILDNAVSSMPEGGTVVISLHYEKQDKMIKMEIADTGIGIPPEDMGRIFEPYFSRKRGGTGLGLSIVSSIISDHNGSIEVAGNEPKGTKFIIYLPETQGEGHQDV